VNWRVVMSEFSERRGVVTGAASGIGRATALRLARQGASVIAVDINQAGLADAKAAGCETMIADLADPDQRDEVAARADGVDFLVNAAGIMKVKAIFEFTVEDWRSIQTVNAESVFFLCQKIGPAMRHGGAIVNLSSSSAKLASTIEVAPYAASKTAILSITRSFAYALAPRRVRVNAICPGIIDTVMQDRVLSDISVLRGMTREELSQARERTVPLGRAASPDECAGLIGFLLSDDSSYMTGQAIDYSGGLVMQ
jgi:NAD(P)-dependent dehydrogenase (short-subunit alcohol dehydrogenase family)